jgi:ubiquinone/menaquinone biosynthesis C-methylase UbiE
VPTRHGAIWADLGAGSGTFSEALAELLGKTGKVFAVERDARALRELRRAAAQSGGVIEAVEGDLLELDAIPALQHMRLNGALFANVLHFFAAPHEILTSVRRFLRPEASVVVIEYDRRSASRWVPYPLSLQQLSGVAQKAGLTPPAEVGRRASRYQGDLYCAALENRDQG